MERLEAGRLLMILVCFLTRVALSSPPLGELVRSFKHLHQEGVDGRVADQFEEEQVLQALQADGAQCWKPEEELCEPALLIRIFLFAVGLQGSVHPLPQ